VCLCFFRDFALVSVDESRDSYTCHVFRSDAVAACRISDALLTVTGHVITAGGRHVTGSGRTDDDVTGSDCVRRRTAATDNHDHVTTTSRVT